VAELGPNVDRVVFVLDTGVAALCGFFVWAGTGSPDLGGAAGIALLAIVRRLTLGLR